MQLSQQVTSLETSKRLKELGVKQESLFYHYQQFINGEEVWDIFPGKVYEFLKWKDNDSVHRALNGDSKNQVYSAFTVADLANIMGPATLATEYLYNAVLRKLNQGLSFRIAYDPDFVAQCLIHLLQNNLLDNEK